LSRCEAPFLHCHKIECWIMRSTPAQKAVDSTPAVSFFAGSSTASLLGPFRLRRAEAISERRRTTSSVTNVLYRSAFDEAKSGRCDIDRPLAVNK
jgi:hypothetical protein